MTWTFSQRQFKGDIPTDNLIYPLLYLYFQQIIFAYTTSDVEHLSSPRVNEDGIGTLTHVL